METRGHRDYKHSACWCQSRHPWRKPQCKSISGKKRVHTCVDMHRFVCMHTLCLPSTVRVEGGSAPLHEELGCPPPPSAFKSPQFPKASKSCREIKALQGQRHLKPPPYASAGPPLLLLRVGSRRKMTALGVEMPCRTQQGEG